MKAQLEIITPAAAKDLLERNSLNRKVSQKTVDRYAADMRAGQWNNNGQGIVISVDGDLLDGQHRMQAIIASQASVGMLVVRGVDRGVFATMDSGKPRSLPDVLSIQGYSHVNITAAIARGAYSYIAGARQSYSATKATLDGFIMARPYIQEIAKYVGNLPNMCPRGPMATVLFLGNARRNLNEEVESFLDGVIHGEGMRRGDARYTLREWLAAERIRTRGQLRGVAVFAAVGRAWNAYASGKELAAIKGLDVPTLKSMPIFGFERSDYPEVPDVIAVAAETARTNLSKVRPLRKPTVEHARPYFASVG